MNLSPQTAEISALRSQQQKRAGGALLAVLAGGFIWMAPTPQGLTPVGQAVVAILAFTVILWMFSVLDNASTALLMLALMMLAGVKPEHALGVFSGSAFWILLVVLFYGFAMESTGLAKRLSYMILSWFPPTYAGVMGAFFVIGLILSLGIPSMTVRTAILVPIAWALVQTLGLKPRSRGSALIMLSTVEMAVIPGCATLYGSLWGPVMVRLFNTQGYELQWVPYATALALPTVVWSLLLLLGNWLALRPEEELTVSRDFASSERARMGKMTRHEKITAIVVAVSIVYWVAGNWHHQPPYLVGMLALAVFAAAGILKEKDFGTAVSWPLVLFLGGIFALPDIIKENHVADWLTGYIVPAVESVSVNPLVLVMGMAIAMFALKFTDPGGFFGITVLFLPISSLLRDSPISPIVLIAALLFAGHPFWVSYQNIWIAMLEGMTGNLANDGAHRVRLAHVYFLVSLFTLTLSVWYWRALGLLG